MTLCALAVAPLLALGALSLRSASAAVADNAAAGARRRPNVIVVLVDDAGYADFPFFEDDRPRTPQIDRLAKEGICFSQFYVNAPICSPSRAALVTGKFPARVGITTFIAAREENRRRGIRDWLDPHVFTLPRALQQLGYATGHFGKWHLGGGRDVGEAPLITHYGFDDSLTQFEGLGDRVLPLVPDDGRETWDKLPLGAQSEELGRGDIVWKPRDDVTGAFVRAAIDFVRQAEQDQRPFYVNVWPDDVHTPLFPPEDLMGDGGKRERYLGVLQDMDAQFSELFDLVRNSSSLRDNTLILVLSDNGHEPGAGSSGDLRGAKGLLYEGGIREPLIVWGPGLVDAKSVGATNDSTLVSSVDLVASLLAMTGASVPDDADLDGEDLSGALTGMNHQTRTKPLMWVRPPDRPGGRRQNLPDLAIREGRWKLLIEDDGSGRQLYDIHADPTENVNLAQQRPKIADRLQELVLQWHQDVRGKAADRSTGTR